MNSFLILLFSLVTSGSGMSENAETASEELQPQEKMTIYYIIRHAEKDISNPADKDPQLSEEGVVRAEKWAEIFENVDFDAVLSSDFNRTRKTADAIATKTGKTVDIYDVRDLYNEEFKQKTQGKTVLVVGHSNTNPALVNKIIAENKYQALEESEYGSLFIVNVAPDGTTSSQMLNIN